MKPVDIVGIDARHIAMSSAEMMFKIDRKCIGKDNPISRKKMMTNLPFNELSVGQSIWVNLDKISLLAITSVRRAANRYSEVYPGMFCMIKHRGDARKVGYMWLEIGRVK